MTIRLLRGQSFSWGASWPVALVAPFLVQCAMVKQAVSGGATVAMHGGCPDMTSTDSIDKFDFAGAFTLPPATAAKVRAGVSAAVEIQALAAKIDTDLTNGCGTLAKDLGDPTSYTNGQDACRAAAHSIGDAKAKLGPKASIQLDVSEPHCGVDVGLYGSCAASCDPTVKPGSVDVQCDSGQLQGTCSGQCSGDCETAAGAACTGECDGSCDANVSGSCSGACTGKCDGKTSRGAACDGKCEGSCSGNIRGACSGNCGGTCHLGASASCSGTCTGTCSVTMDAPKCAGSVKPPQMSADCQARCDAQVQAHGSCTPPHVLVHITNASDPVAAARLQTVLQNDLPLVLSVAVGMAKNVGGIVASEKALAEGVAAALKSGPTNKMLVGALLACVASPLKGATDATTGIQGDVSVSINVQGSVSGGSSL